MNHEELLRGSYIRNQIIYVEEIIASLHYITLHSEFLVPVTIHLFV